MTTYAGQNIGAGKMDRVLEGARKGNCAMMFVSMLISWTLGAMITLVMYKRGKWMEKAKLVLGDS